MQEGDPILGGDANNVSGGQTPENGSSPSLSDTNDSTAKDVDAALSSAAMPESSESSDSSELKISHNDSPTPPPVHILGQDITGITDEDFTPASPSTEPAPQIIMPSGSPEASTEPTALETPATPEANAALDLAAIPTDPNAAAVQAPAVESPVTSTTSAAAAPFQSAPQSATPATPTQAQPESPVPDSDYAAEFKQSVKASVSGESGDIVLAKDPKDPKKTRKGLIIGIVIAAIVVIVLCVSMIFLNQNKQTNLSTLAISPLEKTFNSYANLLVYGTDSNQPLPDDFNDTYYYSKMISYDPDISQSYFNQLAEKYNIFYEQYKSTNGSNNPDTDTLLLNNQNLIDLAKTVSSTGILRPSDVAFYFAKYGEAETDATYGENLIKKTNNQYIKEISDLEQDEYENLMQYLVEINNAGCIIDYDIDDDCTFNLVDSNPDIQTYLDIATESYNKSKELLENDYDILGSNCWLIKQSLEDQNS